MKLEDSVNVLRLEYKVVVATGFWKPSAIWKGCPNGIEHIFQR